MYRVRTTARGGAVAVALGITAAAALLLALAPVAASAQENGGQPGAWLSGYTGARTLGLGGSFVATADDALGILWNPAGVTQLDRNQVTFENARLFEDTSTNALSFGVPGSWLPSFGATVLALRSGDFEKTNELNDNLGTFNVGETAYLFTVAKAFGPRLAVGSNLKVVQQKVEDSSAGGLGFDLGGLYHLTPGFTLGASLLNLGGPSLQLRNVSESYPAEFRVGFSARLLHGNALVTGQLDQLSGPGTRLHAGGEYWIQPTFALRAGFDDNAGTGGMSFRFTPQYQFDYGIADHALGMTHRVALSYRFGGFFASSTADPEVFSPTGERSVTELVLNARTKAQAESWTLTIVGKNDQPVRTFGGKGLPPAHVSWDGKDETGLPLADGTYRYQLVVRDAEGREVVGPMRSVQISTGGPDVKVPVITQP